MEQKNSVTGFLYLSISIVIFGLLVFFSLHNIKSNDTITVTGSARKPITSDYVVWRGSVSVQLPSMQNAYKELKKSVERTKQYFHDQGVADSSVEWQSLQTNSMPEFIGGRETGKISSYRLLQQFEVRGADIKKIEILSQKANELILEGIPIESYPLEYLVTKLNEFRMDMLAEATKDAHARAEKIAEGVGSKVGAIRNAKVGVFQVTRLNSNAVSDYGMYDTSTNEKEIMAVVSVSFAIR